MRVRGLKHRLDEWDLADTGDSYSDHVKFMASVEARKKEIVKKRPKKRKRKRTYKRHVVELTPTEVERRAVLATYETRELKQELRRRTMAAKTPEEIAASYAKAADTRERRRAICKHGKLPPKQKTGGPKKGKWYCPTCFAIVPAPRKEMVIVV